MIQCNPLDRHVRTFQALAGNCGGFLFAMNKPARPVANDRRGSSAERGYGYAWQKAREAYLRKHPLCKMHADLGQVVAATVVDHVEPHRGDMVTFWDSDNWQSLCKTCHDGAKQRQEKSGVVVGCNLAGLPLDPNHHWNKSKTPA